MSEKSIQEQINEINRKLDLLIDEASLQKQNREAVSDLIDDVSIIGKDAFRQMVNQLDDAAIELDSDALRCLMLRLLRNIKTLGEVLGTLESLNDLVRDVTPIIKQIGLDGVRKFHSLEQKGYFEIINQLAITMDTFISRYNIGDIRKLSENLVPVADTLASLADPALLGKINAGVSALKAINAEEVEEYSVWRLMKEINKPEVKRSIGFVMTFLKKINRQQSEINND
jgi:uncharacterized protein YjgD (DUF1641 family)